MNINIQYLYQSCFEIRKAYVHIYIYCITIQYRWFLQSIDTRISKHLQDNVQKYILHGHVMVLRDHQVLASRILLFFT